jgi:single-strand DNA-binding protein
MSNSISFLGRVVNDPELKEVGQNSILELTIANNVGFGDRQVTNWFRCALWGKRASSLHPHMSKGKQVFVTGQLSLRKFTDREGVERISPDIRVSEIEFAGDRASGQGGSETYSAPASTPKTQSSAPVSPETEDDMPF